MNMKTDVAGRVIRAGDTIAYATRLGNSAEQVVRTVQRIEDGQIYLVPQHRPNARSSQPVFAKRCVVIHSAAVSDESLFELTSGSTGYKMDPNDFNLNRNPMSISEAENILSIHTIESMKLLRVGDTIEDSDGDIWTRVS
ncbi:hypothetical protein SmaMPs15_000073 [Stenotrophomonas maltophilia phage vB_SmaM_Ps15]|uniref:Uncharacterized protein n=1 Tax=Stenotrophomonas maltophilia phage vB_SmaM_Ps15 TaxID=3071007 RepID=A0AAE9JWL0_9CAUD|nr:hypothetical protein PQC01_gp073 [Stenotrophomonas maltophilia phage vB_SmaM_Ps15]UMO77224.1 hypothetical protein SmaMPs15_000073 [Stenotrophomonas maltophilia phage vB_SmaM_Ps15]